MKHAKKYAIALACTTLLYNNCSGFKGVGEGFNNLASSAGTTVPTPPPFVQGIDPHPTATPAPIGTPLPLLPNTYPATTTFPPKQTELPKIASNFNVDDWINQGYAGGTGRPEYGPYEGVGAFRFICKPSHNLYDDPIVYPGQPGASHLHTFFGNTMANANSTYSSLRTTGDGTCAGGPLNRSAYWFPSLRIDDGDGDMNNDKVVMPDWTGVYYKMGPETSAPMPRGARIIFGFNFADPTKSSGFWWLCLRKDGQPGGQYHNLKEMADANKCGAGDQIEGQIGGPTCWDGRLDSPDHRSHMAFPQDTHLGYSACPPTHPYHFPFFLLALTWTVGPQGNAEIAKMYLSSDHMGPPGTLPGATLHTDWFGAWDDNVVAEWMGHADSDARSCSGGDLCDGRGLKDPFNVTHLNGYNSLLDRANPRLVDPPVHP